MILIIILVLFIICFILMSDMERKMYFWTIQNIEYFTWLQGKGFTATDPIYIVKCYGSILLFPLFPIISKLIPNWDKLFHLEGSFYVIPISIKNNKQLCKNVQSKMFWYNFFTEMNINTPLVYYHSNKLINEIPDDKETFIMKPEYGTQGSQISQVTLEEYKKHSSKNVLLQKLVKDCTYDKARHFRINTLSNNKVFSIIEKKQHSDKIASNGANGAKNTICENLICNFLSLSEQNQINDISLRLAYVHSNNLKDIPHIGWDVCLTCDGPYVFEGNLGACVDEDDGIYEKYLKVISDFYKNKKL